MGPEHQGPAAHRFGCEGQELRAASVAHAPTAVGPACDAGAVIVRFEAALWIWDARREQSWTFVSLPTDASEEIRDLVDHRAGGARRGFGSVRVQARIGATVWTTSIFPDGGRNAYVLPIKRAVRRAENLDAGDVASVTVELVDA